MQDRTLFLLDGHALTYRAHYAFISRPLFNSKGLNTSAITGFVRMLWDIMKNQQPSHIAVSFDLSEDTFRNEMYPEYKANRDAQPEEITAALPYIKKIVEGFNIPIVELSRFEADDVIGTLAKKAEKKGFKVFMVTPDKDYGQLVTENIFIYKPGTKGEGAEVLGPDEVKAKWDIAEVDQVIDMLGLQGDSVDNIPGIPGIGPKTASKLLKQYGSLENILEQAENLKGKQRERVIENAELAALSKKLATIEINAPIAFDEDRFKTEKANRDVLTELFRELEFRTLAQQILDAPHREGVQASLFDVQNAGESQKNDEVEAYGAHKATLEDTDHEYVFVDTPNKRSDLIEALSHAKSFCFDTETTGLDANQAELVGMSFSWEVGKAYYVPVPDDQQTAQKIVEEFRPLFENPLISKKGQNLKYDALILKWYGITLKGFLQDSMILHYLLEPEMRHSMDYLSETYLNYKPVSITSLIGKKGKKQLSMRDVEPRKVSDYACEDADITLQLVDFFVPKVEAEANLISLYKKMEEPLLKVLVDLEYNGVRVDATFLQNYSKELTAQIGNIEQAVYEESGQKFNIASPKQVGEVLFDVLGLPYKGSKTKTGQYSTDENRLSQLAGEHKVVDKILEYRMLSKLKSTYVDALPQLINPRDGRIHSSFNQALAATGRLSSNHPNLQNIPIRTAEGRKVREAFVPADDDHVLMAADYSQIELRIIAEISKDEAMIEAFVRGQDIHRATAAKVFGVEYEKVTSDQRRQAKTVNFSIIYGAGSTNLSQQLDIPRAEAKSLIDNYFAQYKDLKKYMDNTVEFAREHGFVETLLGRRRTLRNINSRNRLARSGSERIAINTPIQGTAADMIKLAMIKIQEIITTNNYKTKMILQVHDELVFDMPKSEVNELKPLIVDTMKNAMPDFGVPILVEANTGNNWLEAH